MTIPNLECFLLVAQLRSFSKAAGKLFLTPPAVTQQINSLECELGVKLFVRDNKGTKLTPAGEVFYRDAQSIVALLDESIKRARQAAGIGRKHLNIGVWGGSGYVLIPAICQAFADNRPDIELRFINTGAGQYQRMLREREIDLDITFGIAGRAFQGLQILNLYYERPQCMIPRESALASLSRVSFCDLRGRNLVIPQIGASIFHDKLRQYVTQNEPLINVIDVYENETGLIQMLVMDAAALCPASIAECGKSFALRQFDWEEYVSIDIVKRDENDELLDEFISVARDCIRELGY